MPEAACHQVTRPPFHLVVDPPKVLAQDSDYRLARADTGDERRRDSGDTSLDLASHVRLDERLVPVLLPLGDGLLAAVKRGD